MSDPLKPIAQPGVPLHAGRPLNQTPPKAGQGSGGELEKACRDFESLFVHHMLKQMRETVPRDGLFSGGDAEQLYTSMLDSEMAKSISHGRGIGLSSVLNRQLAMAGQNQKKMIEYAKVVSESADRQDE